MNIQKIVHCIVVLLIAVGAVIFSLRNTYAATSPGEACDTTLPPGLSSKCSTGVLGYNTCEFIPDGSGNIPWTNFTISGNPVHEKTTYGNIGDPHILQIKSGNGQPFVAGTYITFNTTPGNTYCASWRWGPNTDSTPNKNPFEKTLGLDPTGGTSPSGSSVIWGSTVNKTSRLLDYNPVGVDVNYNTDIKAVATGTSMTLFVKTLFNANISSFVQVDQVNVFDEGKKGNATPTPIVTSPSQPTATPQPVATNTPVPGGVCKINGYKVPTGSSIDGLAITLKDVNGNVITQTNGQPYFFLNLTGNAEYIVEAAPNGSMTVGSTSCTGRTDCHSVADTSNASYAAGTTRRVTCPSGGYVDLWWHYVDPNIVPTPTPPPGTASVSIKIQTPDGRPVAVPYMYSLECINGVHDCSAINFCRHIPPLQRYVPEYTFTVAVGGNACKTGVGFVLDTQTQQYAGINVVPGTNVTVDQWSVPNQNRIEYNVAWSNMTAGNTYDATVTVDELIHAPGTPTPSPTGIAGGGTWGTADGKACTNPQTSGQNFVTVYTQSSCAGTQSYQMPDIASYIPCSSDGTGECFMVKGSLAAHPALSQRSKTQPSCVNKPVTGIILPSFSEVEQCTWYPSNAFPTPATPAATATPNPMAWYAQDGSLCNQESFAGRNYVAFYTGSLCGGQAGYRTDGVQPQTPCSTDGSGVCYKPAGNIISFSASSMWWIRGGSAPDQQCINVAPAFGVSDMYDSIVQCSWSGSGHQTNPTPTVSSCFNQQVAGDYNCDWSVTMKDFTDWLPDFLGGRTTLAFFEYWRRAYIGGGPAPTLTPTPPGYVSPTPLPAATSTPATAPTSTPVVPGSTSTPVPTIAGPITCPSSSTNSYAVIDREASFIGATTYPSGDPVPADHPDLNLIIRGFSNHTASAGISGGTAVSPLPPQFATMFRPARMAQMIKTYRVYGWNWNHSLLPYHGTKDTLLTNPDVTLVGVATTPGEVLFAPFSDYHIGENVPTEAQVTNPYQVSVLYADQDRITLTYTRNDTVSGGYTVHIEDICVDPSLIAAYQTNGLNNPANRKNMVVLRSQRNPKTGATNTGAVPFGVAKSGEVKVTIRTGLGSFADPRWLNWWQTL